MLPFVMYISKLSMLNTYFSPSVFLFALFTATHEAYTKFNPPKDYIREDPYILIPAFLCFGYILTLGILVIMSLHKRANESPRIYTILSSVLGLYNMFLIIIVVIYIVFNYFVETDVPSSARVTREIIKYLTIVNVACLVVPVTMHIFTHPRHVFEMLDPRTLLSYLYYQAIYSHTFVIYAFANVDDVSWGTKGVQQEKNKHIKTKINHQDKQYYNDKLAFFGKWIVANALFCFILILINEIFVEEQNKAIILTAIGMYSTALLALKCIFGMLHHFWCFLLDIFCVRRLRYNEQEQKNMEKRL